MVLLIPFRRFYPDSCMPVLSLIQPSNFRSSFECQTRQHLVNTMVLVHPPRGLLSTALNVRAQLFRSLGAYQVSSMRAVSLFLSRSLPIKWAFASSAPDIIGLSLASLP